MTFAEALSLIDAVNRLGETLGWCALWLALIFFGKVGKALLS